MTKNYENDTDVVNNLDPDEHLIAVARISLWNYRYNFIFIGFWFLIFFFLLFGVTQSNLNIWAGDGVNGILAAPRYEYLTMLAPYANKWWFWILKFIPLWFVWSSLSSLLYGYAAIKLILTDQRVIASSNFFQQDVEYYRLTKLESVVLSQDMNGKIFGYGDLRLRGEGGNITLLQGFKDVHGFRKKLITAQKKALEKEKS